MGAWLLAVSLGTCGCAAPLLHPLRATNGWVGEAAASLYILDGKQGHCYEGCSASKNITDFNLAAGSIGYSHVSKGWLGTMAGIYSPALENQRNPYAFAAFWTYFTAQTDHLAAGVGPEIGPGGVAVLVGAEVQPFGIAKDRWTPAIGVYGRWFFPYDPSVEGDNARARTAEYGARAHIGPLLFEYSYYHPRAGRINIPLPVESSLYADGYHILTIGVTFDQLTRRPSPPRPPPAPTPRHDPEVPP